MGETQILDPLPEESPETETVSGNTSDQDLTFENSSTSETVSDSDVAAESAAPETETAPVPETTPTPETIEPEAETEIVQTIEVNVSSPELITAVETGFTSVCVILGLILGVLIINSFFTGRD